MSRIDEALRRAASARPSVPGSAQQEVFVSAWGTTRPAIMPMAEPAVSAPTGPHAIANESGAERETVRPSPIPQVLRLRTQGDATERNGGKALSKLTDAWGELVIGT